MSETAQRLKRALKAIQELKREVSELRSEKHEAIAIVGAGCRFPGGVDSLESFWRLLKEGVDAIDEIPGDRWPVDRFYDSSPDAKGKMSVKHGGFLNGIDRFDAGFFGLSPREAAYMDPQQRLLMEVAWRCLEDAMIPRHRLDGARGGVFIGISGTDYSQMLLARDPAEFDMYMGSGNAHSVAAGRLSYWLGLQGPCVAIDTACSSSLTAVHLACRSLRARECDIALAGGVNLILTPMVSINHSRAKMLSPDGRCKAFGAAADGFSRSEGCGVAALKRLSDAQRDGDRILAVIRGSAANQDGKTSGITVPNAISQTRLIHEALDDARLEPEAIDYIEAHGTGTALGDPIEIEALQAAFGAARDSTAPLPVGSVKSNFGHTEAAAGVAGLFKAMLCLMHRELPPSLHCEPPNPRIDWASSPVKPVARLQPLAARDERLHAGVSSFGFGGSNAHVILEEAPPQPVESKPWPGELHVLPLSAAGPEALRQLVQSYAADALAAPEAELSGICHWAAVGRSHFKERIAAVGRTAHEMNQSLQSRIENAGHDVKPLKTAFLFTGQGSQYIGMARALRERSSFFNKELQRCDEILKPALGRSIVDVIDDADASGAIHQTAFTQPALVALETALARLWMRWGVAPDAVMGHSAGEYAAAIVAGVFTLEDGLRLVAERARLMQSLPRDGGMLAALAPRDRVEAIIASDAPALSVAAFNGPRNTVVSGRHDDLTRIRQVLERDDIDYRELKVSHAFHSACMNSILNEFESFASAIDYSQPTIDFVSNLTGRIDNEAMLSAAYWRRHIRQPVEFETGMQALHREGINTFIEIGPNPVLCGMGRMCIDDAGLRWIASLSERSADWDSLASALATLYEAGAALDWARIYEDCQAGRVELPGYPFQRERHWVDTTDHLRLPGQGRTSTQWLSPLIEREIELAHEPGLKAYETSVDPARFAFLNDHIVGGGAIAPGSLLLAMMNEALIHSGRERSIAVDIRFHQPLRLSSRSSARVQTIFSQDENGAATIRQFAQNESEGWKLIASAKSADSQITEPAPCPLEELKERLPKAIDADDLYANYKQRGVEFGPSFRAIESVWLGDGECLARLRLPSNLDAGGFHAVHPVLIDACAQAYGALRLEDAPDDVFLQAALDRCEIDSIACSTAWCHVSEHSRSSNDAVFSCTLYDDAGKPIAWLDRLGVHRSAVSALAASEQSLPLYTVAWKPVDRADRSLAEMASPETVAQSVRASMQAKASDVSLQEYLRLMAELDRVSVNCMKQCILQVMPELKTGASVSLDDIMSALGAASGFKRLIKRWLVWLQAQGALIESNDAWRLAEEPAALSYDDEFSALRQRFSCGRAEIDVLETFVNHQAAILKGEINPATLLFDQGDAVAEAIYRDSPGAEFMNSSLAGIVEELARSAGRPLRVLETGGGVGGATSFILPLLSRHPIEYTFTDLSPKFLTQAKAKFPADAPMQFKTFDLERDPLQQGFEPGSYDLVVAFNVIHATRDARQSLRHIRSLLRPGGRLAMMENTRAAAWVELVWGTMEGWWRFEDEDLRGDQPLLSEEAWRSLLEAEGYSATACLTPRQWSGNDQFTQSILIAENPTDDSRISQTLVVSDEFASRADWAFRLGCNPDHVIMASPGAEFLRLSDLEYELNVQDRDQTRRFFGEIANRFPSLDRILYSWGGGIDSESLSGEAFKRISVEASLSLVNAVNSLVEEYRGRSVHLTVLTQGVHGQDSYATEGRITQSCLWGLARTAMLEAPSVGINSVDMPAEPGLDDWRALNSILESYDNAEQFMIHNGEMHSARLEEITQTLDSLPVSADGACLVVGGFGALGLQAARALIERGARRITLAGRRGAASAEAQRMIEEWRASGVSIQEEKVDVADNDALAAMLQRIRSEAKLKGVIFAAGAPGYKQFDELSEDDFNEQYHAKAQGALNLWRATQHDPLDFSIWFSSMVSLWGAAGQAHYAAANTILDAIAAAQRAQGMQAVSINWGPIEGGGMLPDEIIGELARMGVSTAPLQGCMAMFDCCQALPASHAAPVSIDWPRFLGVYEARGRRSLFDALRERVVSQRSQTSASKQSIRQELDAMIPAARRERLSAHIRRRLSEALCLDPSKPIRSDQGFFDLGMDSLTAMELKNALQADLDASLPSTLAFDYSTLSSMTDFLMKECGFIQAFEKSEAIETQTRVEEEQLDDMTEEEAERLLLEKLEGLEGH